MDLVKIGERAFAITRPADLDARMLASTGSTSAEQSTMLGRAATPFAIARALQPLLGETDAMPVGELADLIAAADGTSIAAQVVAALTPPAPNGLAVA